MALLQVKDVAIVCPSVNHAQVVYKLGATKLKASRFSGIPFALSTFKSIHHIDTPWIIDSGATVHMICSTTFFFFVTSKVSYYVKLPNGTSISVSHLGNVQITDNISLKDVLCVPSFCFNLI